MSQGEVWALARGDDNGAAASTDDVLRMAQEVVRATLDEARAEAERIRASALDEARAESESIRTAAEDEAANIRAQALLEAKQFENELRSMETEIAALGEQLAAIEAQKAQPPLTIPPPPLLVRSSWAAATSPPLVASGPSPVPASPRIRWTDATVERDTILPAASPFAPAAERNPVPEVPAQTGTASGWVASAAAPMTARTEALAPAVRGTEVPELVDEPQAVRPTATQQPQPRLSPIPLEAVLPILALVLLLVVVLAWLG